MLNNIDEVKEAAVMIAQSFDVKVHFVADITKGTFNDLKEASILAHGFPTETSRRVALMVRNLLNEMEQETPKEPHRVIVIAHSKGGATVGRGIERLTSTERSQLEILFIGSPMIIPPDSVKRVRSFRCISDPVAWVTHHTNERNPTFIVTSEGESVCQRIAEHGILGPTYSRLIAKLGEEFRSSL